MQQDQPSLTTFFETVSVSELQSVGLALDFPSFLQLSQCKMQPHSLSFE